MERNDTDHSCFHAGGLIISRSSIETIRLYLHGENNLTVFVVIFTKNRKDPFETRFQTTSLEFAQKLKEELSYELLSWMNNVSDNLNFSFFHVVKKIKEEDETQT